jgi:hypothetical protein
MLLFLKGVAIMSESNLKEAKKASVSCSCCDDHDHDNHEAVLHDHDHGGLSELQSIIVQAVCLAGLVLLHVFESAASVGFGGVSVTSAVSIVLLAIVIALGSDVYKSAAANIFKG